VIAIWTIDGAKKARAIRGRLNHREIIAFSAMFFGGGSTNIAWSF
jgi:hypothetical protein